MQEKQVWVRFRSNSKTFSFKEKSDAHWQEFCSEIQTWLAGTELIARPHEPIRPRPYNMCEKLSWTALTKDRIYKLRMPLKKPVLSQVLRHFYRKNNNVAQLRGNSFRTIYWEDGKRKAKRSTHSEIQTHKLTFTSRVLGRCATIADLSRQNLFQVVVQEIVRCSFPWFVLQREPRILSYEKFMPEIITAGVKSTRIVLFVLRKEYWEWE